MTLPVVIREHELEDFRRRQLAPAPLLDLVERHVRALLRLPVGVGKSYAVDGLIEDRRLFEAFHFVVYAAPTWSIIRERRIFRGTAEIKVPWMLLRPRPKDWCADYAEPWEQYERRSCSTYAKGVLCRECQRLGKTASPCNWPTQFSRIKDHRLLLMTEQQLMLNRALVPMVRGATGAERFLVIIDEARLLDADFEIAIADEDLTNFARVLVSFPETSVRSRWLASIDAILKRRDLDGQFELPAWLNHDAFTIQKAGIERFGDAFRYVGYDLALFGTSKPAERWRDGDGIRFIGRPFLNCHVLVLSAHLTGDYVGERLGGSPMASPFEHLAFQHSGTRIVNLRSRIGADRYFRGNHKQILDTVAVLIASNVRNGITTVLISRKKSKDFSAHYLTQRLAGWGVDVRFVSEDYSSLPPQPQPQVVPLIHYGILGVNDFTDYQSAFCINGYYISSRELTRAAQESTPKTSRKTLCIDSRPDLVRRVKVTEGPDPGGVLAHTANIYLRKLELDPVIQAVGRVRFATKPRFVCFFQMADLAPFVGEHQVVHSLAQLRQALGISSAREVDDYREAVGLADAIRAGATAGQVATQAGVSVRTLRRRLRRLREDRIPSSTIRRESGTPPAGGGSA